MSEARLKKRQIAVLGAGAWGSALAIHLARKGHSVRLWAHRKDQADALSEAQENVQYLPGVAFPPNLSVSSDLAHTVNQTHAILVVVPSQAFRGVLAQLAHLDFPAVPLAWATKGFEPETCLLLHQVAEQTCPKLAATVLSGPTFAQEVAQGLPTAMVSASAQPAEALFWAEVFQTDTFRMYTQSDMAGVEVGGAYKNIMAIATGLSDGMALGANARAALISRGLVEVMRLATALGGHQETVMGLSGLGDLVLTCTDDLSRNRRFGKALAQAQSQSGLTVQAAIDQAVHSIGQVVEGVKAVEAVHALSQRQGIELPIMHEVWCVLQGQKSVSAAAKALLSRSGKSEQAMTPFMSEGVPPQT